jgi:hypothetical protein
MILSSSIIPYLFYIFLLSYYFDTVTTQAENITTDGNSTAGKSSQLSMNDNIQSSQSATTTITTTTTATTTTTVTAETPSPVTTTTRTVAPIVNPTTAVVVHISVNNGGMTSTQS